MRFRGLVLVVLIAFAANSVLNRAAVGSGQIDALSFAVLRVFFGALALVSIVIMRKGHAALVPRGRWIGGLCLALYMAGFSLAYLSLDSGVGALILFGGVQIVMFVGSVLSQERVPALRWIGALVALAGLAYLLWPAGGRAPSIIHAGAMGLAALGWGLFSLIGRGSRDPLATMAMSFVIALPLVAGLLPAASILGQGLSATPRGILLAAVSGIATSGLGYALWYSVLPRLGSATAALVQLLVPVLATFGGIAFLGETAGLRLVLASALVLGGVALGVLAGQARGRTR